MLADAAVIYKGAECKRWLTQASRRNQHVEKTRPIHMGLLFAPASPPRTAREPQQVWMHTPSASASNAPTRHQLASAVSEVSRRSWAHRLQPSSALPAWLAAGVCCREEREWPSCEANCSPQRERERKRGRQTEKGEVEEKVCSGTSHPQRPKVCNDWLQACGEGGREGKGGKGGRQRGWPAAVCPL